MKISRNNLKLSFSRPKYYVDEKKGLTKCFLKAELLMPKYESGISVLPSDRTSFSTKYTAICRGTDKFSIEKGKKIALAMAETNLYNQALDSLKKSINYFKEFSNIAEMLNTFETKAKMHNAHNDAYVDNITD